MIDDKTVEKLAKIFKHPDLLFIEIDGEPFEPKNPVSNNLPSPCATGIFVRVKYLLYEGDYEYDGDNDVLMDSNVDYAEADKVVVELYNDIDTATQKLKDNGVTLYTVDSLNAHIAANGINATFRDLVNDDAYLLNYI